MKTLMLGLLAAATLVTGASAAEAKRGHDNYRHGGAHRGYERHRWSHGPYHHRRGYWYYRHGHRYHGWR
ncbi:hypothetical protein FHS31_002599 [Sphingomonas vulcanisoli]|uniref:Sulfur globule protein n=1 Tax=Sphingomonas vulcanisoli TaxID=1658060 RepID=A0ABX0TW85_9SPHN|nr:hypothetical protein [Sphingomonas vulcanisoli]NIJ08969.1 hypothetical protein [Sphingomonas vulcanisoli]